MPKPLSPRVPRNDRLSPGESLGLSLLLSLLGWAGIYELAQLGCWLWKLVRL